MLSAKAGGKAIWFRGKGMAEQGFFRERVRTFAPGENEALGGGSEMIGFLRLLHERLPFINIGESGGNLVLFGLFLVVRPRIPTFVRRIVQKRVKFFLPE
ncbi:MAG: hypothetical protein LBT97_11885 [Planctomycetota bacterium]|nr:hypothetical protein [Planctomycetota bacterium]